MNEAAYWIDLAKYDLETAKAMNSTQRYLYVGFMCHQAMEKALKAYYSHKVKDVPPYIHNLSVIAKKADLYSQMSEKQKDFPDFLEPLNIEARYPKHKDKLLNLLSAEQCNEIIEETESELQWVMKIL
ncbi:MAG: HEPN domain-containing protein [Planctomycetaceae bacterium]|nr:HEPN domain-containing protein [Planctomycetaceae bacterium]